MGFLPGEAVPFSWTTPILQMWLGSFHLRLDEKSIYLVYGHEDLLMVLPRLGRSRDLTSRTLSKFMYSECLRKLRIAAELERIVSGVQQTPASVPGKTRTSEASPNQGSLGNTRPKRSKGHCHTLNLPGSIVKCEVCGDYRGAALAKELNWGDSAFAAGYSRSEKIITVSCLCDGIPCPRCKRNLIHRPISNTYDPDSNRIWHIPYFGMMPCKECRKNLP